MVDTEILHDPKYLITWGLRYCGILRSCRIFRINNTILRHHPKAPKGLKYGSVRVYFYAGQGIKTLNPKL